MAKKETISRTTRGKEVIEWIEENGIQITRLRSANDEDEALKKEKEDRNARHKS